MRLSVGKASCVSFSCEVAAQVLAKVVTPVVLDPRCGLLLVAIFAPSEGDGLMAAESSMVSEVRFQGVLGPKFMNAVEGNFCSVFPLTVPMS